MIAANIIHAAHETGVEKLLFLGSSCIYPKFADQPIVEEALLTGALEPTNEWYAIAKIAGIKLCQAYRKQHGADFISAMPTNLYGPGDNYDLQSSHVIPALIRKAHEAKRAGAPSMEIWGTGTPRREFLHADDCADALVHLMKVYSAPEHVNVGSGTDVTIEELARLVMAVVGFEGELTKDLSKPDGTPRKLMSADRLRALGWKPSIGLRDGLSHAFTAYLEASSAGQPDAARHAVHRGERRNFKVPDHVWKSSNCHRFRLSPRTITARCIWRTACSLSSARMSTGLSTSWSTERRTMIPTRS